MPIDLATITAGDGSQGFVLQGELANDRSGRSVSSAGDVNGDGFDDLIVGAPRADGPADGRSYAGDSYVVFGKAGGFGATVDLAAITAGNGSQGFVLQGERASDFSGYSVASAGDVNGDGFDDLIVGARFADGPADGRSYAGDSYVIFGKAAGFAATVDLAAITAGNGSQGFVLQGELAGDRSGYSVASAGDVNGDGFDDLIVGAPYADGPADGRSGAGDSYVIFGKAGGFAATIDLAAITAGNGSQGFVLQGELANDRSGRSVSSAGDVNGDGFDDLIVGAFNADGPADGRSDAGDSYVVFGKAGGFAATIDLAAITAGNGSQGFVLQGELAGDQSGFSVASAGDVNGDGFDDLIVGAPFADGPADGRSFAGDSYVIFGKDAGFAATVDLAAITAGDGSQGFVLQGELAGDFSGFSVASAGDVNGDGFDDLIVGARSADGPADGRLDAGDSYVIFGKAGGFAATIDLAAITTGNGSQGFVLQGELAGDRSGNSVSSAGDVNGDGFDDLMVGARFADGPADGRSAAGDSYVIFGSATIGGSTSQVTHPGTAAGETLTGTAGANVMVGGRGNDTLLGNGGADVLRGGEGDDILTIADASFARITGGTGNDTLALAGDFSLSDQFFKRIEGIEQIALGNQSLDVTLGANALRAFNTLAANQHRITIDGSAVTNAEVTIDGGGLTRGLIVSIASSTAATGIVGGDGNDEFTTGSGGDFLTGGGGADMLNGGGGIDDLSGGDGNDTINGGAGADTMSSGDGDDVFIVDSMSDAVEEQDDSGEDEIRTGLASYSIGPLDDVENLTGTSNAGQTLTGNAVANTIMAGAGADTLDGGGGNDTLIGGLGNDIYIVDSVSDTVTEASGAGTGTDEIRTALASYTLASANVENLTGTAGTGQTLTGDGNANVITAGSSNDTLDGGGGNDTIVGGSGNDTIDGGTGADRAVFSGLRSAYTLTALSGNGVQVIGSDGTDTLSNIENLVFDDTIVIWPPTPPPPPPPLVEINGGFHGDFNGNGRSDILFRHADGSIALWQTNAAGQLNSAQPLGSAANAWRIDAIGDFNGNGRDDILFRHDDGSIASWQTNANGQLVSADLLGSTSTAWQVDGIGDFDANGRDDILFRNSNGAIAVWQTNAAGQLVSAQEIGSAATAWHVVGIGDFDSNGRSDILFRNDNGSIAAWQTNAAGQLVSAQTLGSTGTEWHVSGIGDFDGNGRSDILFRNNNNAIAVWQTDAAGQLSSATQIGTTSSDWHINGTGDFNGDSRTDILFRNDDGSIASWQTNTAPQTLGTVANAWTISVHLFDFV